MIPVPVEVPNIVSMPIVIESMLRIEGLHDVFSPYLPLACPSVFSRTKWVKQRSSQKELLRIFDSLQQKNAYQYVVGNAHSANSPPLYPVPSSGDVHIPEMVGV